MSNYSLEIVSRHPQFDGKSLRKYHVNGIETVGAWGDEPFEIRFRNNTWQKVQVKLSVDGTDLFTGKPADTTPSDKMWVVNGYGTLSLKAWPENNNGGAAFVFTSANNSVAIHTHGDLSSRGIIAAAVFTEGHVEPIRLNHYHSYNISYPASSRRMRVCSDGRDFSKGTVSNTTTSANVFNVGDHTYGSASVDCLNVDLERSVEPVAAGERHSKSLESLVAVGAGQHVNQKIVYVPGLIKPTFTETVRVRYQWWNELQDELRAANVPEPHPSGFPGDRHTGINLGNTPRLPEGGVFRRAETFSYQRI